jgi:hypothetical protein
VQQQQQDSRFKLSLLFCCRLFIFDYAGMMALRQVSFAYLGSVVR